MRYASYSEEKYFTDVRFKMLVDTLYQLVATQESSFSEVREAVLLAQLKYEMANPKPIRLSRELLDAIKLGEL